MVLLIDHDADHLARPDHHPAVLGGACVFPADQVPLHEELAADLIQAAQLQRQRVAQRGGVPHALLHKA